MRSALTGADVDLIGDRIGRPLTDPDELRRAASALQDASELVREAGRPAAWAVYAGDAPTGDQVPPPAVITVTVQAALRQFRNPDGMVVETRGPFTRRRADGQITIYLSDEEVAIIRRLQPGARSRGLWSLETTRSEPGGPGRFVDDQYGTEPFPVGEG